MQYGPDGTPISSASILVGPPTTSPAPIPVVTTETIIGPLLYEGGGPNITSGEQVPAPSYAVVVEDEGEVLTNKVTVLNFVGNGVVATNYGSAVTVTINNTGGITAVAAGTGISVQTANTVSTINNTGILSITAGTGIGADTLNGVSTIRNTFTETVYSGGSWSGSVTPNRNNGTVQKFTLTGNITLNVPSNMSAGQSLTLILTQDSTGNRLLNANTAYLFASGFQTLSNASGAIDMLNIFSDGSTYYTTLTVEYS